MEDELHPLTKLLPERNSLWNNNNHYRVRFVTPTHTHLSGKKPRFFITDDPEND